MSNKDKNAIPVTTPSDLRTQLQSLPEYVILTIILEGDDEDGED